MLVGRAAGVQRVNDDGTLRLEISVKDEEKPRVYNTTPDAGGEGASELPEVKLMNEEGMEDRTNGRGGVDDLIDLTHLHEPAILHVLVRAAAAVRAGVAASLTRRGAGLQFQTPPSALRVVTRAARAAVPCCSRCAFKTTSSTRTRAPSCWR